MKNADIIDRLQELNAWSKTGPNGQNPDTLNLLQYLQCVGTIDAFFAYFELLHPALVECDGLYFIADRFSKDVYETWKTNEIIKDKRQIPAVMNHLHVHSLFQDQSLAYDLALEAAERIAGNWSEVFRDLALKGAVQKGKRMEDVSVTLIPADFNFDGSEAP